MATNNNAWDPDDPATAYDFGAYPASVSPMDHQSYQ